MDNVIMSRVLLKSAVALVSVAGAGCVPVYGVGPGMRAAVNTWYFNESVGKTVSAISDGCIQQRFTVTDIGPDYAVCSKPANEDGAINPHAPRGRTLNVRYQAAPFGGGTNVQFASYTSSQTPTGPQVTPLNSKTNNDVVNAFLRSLGGAVPQ